MEFFNQIKRANLEPTLKYDEPQTVNQEYGWIHDLGFLLPGRTYQTMFSFQNFSNRINKERVGEYLHTQTEKYDEKDYKQLLETHLVGFKVGIISLLHCWSHRFF